MSRTVAVGYAGRWFWAYDVTLSLLLVEATRPALTDTGSGVPPWQRQVVDSLLGVAALGANQALLLDHEWSHQQREYALRLIAEAAGPLRARGPMSGQALNAEFSIDGEPVF